MDKAARENKTRGPPHCLSARLSIYLFLVCLTAGIESKPHDGTILAPVCSASSWCLAIMSSTQSDSPVRSQQ